MKNAKDKMERVFKLIDQVLESGEDSINAVLIQRKLSVGFSDAIKLLDALSALEVVKKGEGSPTAYIIVKEDESSGECDTESLEAAIRELVERK